MASGINLLNMTEQMNALFKKIGSLLSLKNEGFVINIHFLKRKRQL